MQQLVQNKCIEQNSQHQPTRRCNTPIDTSMHQSINVNQHVEPTHQPTRKCISQ